MPGWAVELFPGYLAVAVAVEAADEARAAPLTAVQRTLSRSHAASLLHAAFRPGRLGPCRFEFRAVGFRFGLAAANGAGEVVDANDIALRAATVGKLRRVAGLGIAALRAGAVDVH